MPGFICIVCAVTMGIVQGITEWLPVSSTAHLILTDALFAGRIDQAVITDSFRETFDVVVQFGSALAVLTAYFGRLNPFSKAKTRAERRDVCRLWGLIVVAALPAGVAGLVLDDTLSNTVFIAPQVNFVIAGALFFYGLLFIVIERGNRRRTYKITEPESLGFKEALGIGAFQVLALIPGTSRSGSTIIGASALGVSRGAAAEFSFFLAIPVMLGAAGLKMIKFFFAGSAVTAEQLIVLALGTATSFAVSLMTVKFLVSFVRRHSFEVFGWYRIALSILIILYFSFAK